jgi:adhesin/invasin
MAGVLQTACESVPLLAPTGSSITLTSLATALPLNGSTQIIAQVIEASGTPPHSGTHVIFTTSLGTVVPSEAETDVNGRAVVVFQAGNSNGTATITAISGGAGGTTQSGSTTGNGTSTTTTTTATNVVKIAIGLAAVGRVVVSANPTLIPATGGASTISAVVSDLNGNALPSAPVAFSTDAGTINPAVSVTDANGVATSILTTSTTATVTASVGVQSGTGTGGGTNGGGTTGGTTTGSASGTVKVNVATAPGLVITPPTTPPSAGLPATFTFAVTVPTNGGAVRSLTVNWGDGSTQDLGAVSTNAIVAHVYRSAGTYNLTAVLTDASGNVVTQQTSVSVIPVPRPTIIITPSPVPGKVNTQTTLNIQVTLPTGISVQDLAINFGDGKTADLGGANSASVPHVYETTGTFTVTVTVLDTSGQTTVGTTAVSIGP